MLPYQPTPVQELRDPLFDRAGVRVLIKREDLNHPLVAGNKWWKLKYNLEAAKRLGHKTLLTFGGAYSNHIAATAAAARTLGFNCIGLIRGEETLPLNPVLAFARQCGMLLHYVARADYRKKHEPAFADALHGKFGDFYLIPEGGTNALGVKGASELVAMLPTDLTTLCCAVATGGTLAGLINGLDGTKEVIGFAVLKGASFLEQTVSHYLNKPYDNWRINYNWHHGGFARMPEELYAFIYNFQAQYGIKPDGVYMAKLLRGVTEEIKLGSFKRGSTLLILHTGGTNVS